ncbi:MAG: alcohol dehydrogenase [Alphaproteobacteria bacterium PA4]|nr:MAG: alcohol dehydrogenase [Alphaproteobacteria bacterium PA4]
MRGTYRAIRLERFAPTFRAATEIVDLPLTVPGPGEIAVRNHWCGVNGIFDSQIARNAVDYVAIKPPILTGVEAAGVVTSVGPGVSDFRVGDAVATVRFTGGYREGNVGPASQFAAIPAATPEWLALASTGVSALVALEQIGQVQDGETVAISAAAGGLGHLLVQLAKLRGCRVVAVCGGPAKAAFVRSLGADRVIDYKAESVAEVLAAEFPNQLDVAIDTVSGAIFDAFLDNIAPHGRLVVGGAAQDLEGRPEIVTGPRIVHKLYYKSASVRGFMNGLLTPHWPAAREKLFALHAAGRLAVTFDAMRFEGLAAVHDAIDRLLSGQSMGKVIVNLAPDRA